MRKILILAGLDVNIDFNDPEIMDAVNKVLATFNFDPEAPIDDQEMIFTARMMEQNNKKIKSSTVKRTAVMKVDKELVDVQ